MPSLIKTALLYGGYGISMARKEKRVPYGKAIYFSYLVRRMAGMAPKSKFQTEEYKNIYIIGRTAPSIGFGRFAAIRAIPRRNRLFFLNNWYGGRVVGVPYRVQTCAIRAVNLLKSLTFSNHWGRIRHASR